ncbi:RNA-directed DNA polymerase, eukaryota [Tanacetum coccineum]
MVFHNEDGNPARANIKQALGYLKDGDGDGNSQHLRYQVSKLPQTLTSCISTSSAQDGDSLQDDVRLSLDDDLKKAQNHRVTSLRGRLLPTRVNLSRRGVLLDSHLCPLCNAAMEDVQHVFFRCDVARVVLRKICRWWDLDWQEICSFSDWDAWFLSFRLSSRLKSILEGVFYVAWWRIWRLRNQLVFDASPPNRSTIFDDIGFIERDFAKTSDHILALKEENLRMRRRMDSLEAGHTLAAMSRDRLEREFYNIQVWIAERMGWGAMEARPSDSIDVLAVYGESRPQGSQGLPAGTLS